MVSLDFRTRTDDDIRSITTRSFFETELPALIERARRARGRRRARELGVEPFAFETPSGDVDARPRRRRVHRDPRRHRGRVRPLVRRRRRRPRQRPQDADDVTSPAVRSTSRAATSATSSTGGSCCARSSTGGRAHTAGSSRVPRPRRCAARPAPRRSLPTTTTPTSRTSSRRPASRTSAAGSTPTR